MYVQLVTDQSRYVVHMTVGAPHWGVCESRGRGEIFRAWEGGTNGKLENIT
jgi:hypothetical protein